MTRQSDDRRAIVLRSLVEHPEGVSGEMLANIIGVSRVAIRKHIAALRELGYGIEARPGEGYRLLSRPDAPLPLEVAPLLATKFFPRLEGGHVTGSTNDDARSLAIAGAAEGTAVLAAEQRSGRGRLGRSWISPTGGVYTSIVLRPEVETPDAVVLPLVVGLGVSEGLTQFGIDTMLKWPNDVLAKDGRKVAGVLLEGLSEGWRIVWIIAGIGVNVSGAPEVPGAVSVEQLAGRPVDLASVAAAVLDGVAAAYQQWKTEGFPALARAYERRSWLAGREIVVSDAGGHTIAEGIVTGIDPQGRLLVATDGDVVPVAAGDITLRRAGAAPGDRG